MKKILESFNKDYDQWIRVAENRPISVADIPIITDDKLAPNEFYLMGNEALKRYRMERIIKE